MALAGRYAPRPDLVVRMQGIALVGVFLRVTPFARRAGVGREALLEAVRGRLGRFYGKKGAKIVDANLAVITAAFDGLIDVSGTVLGLVPMTQLPPLATIPTTPSDLVPVEADR